MYEEGYGEHTDKIRDHAGEIGIILREQFPPLGERRAVPRTQVKVIADHITLVIADILQAWLDAGSERDVTMEELGPVIEDHVKGWT